MNEKLKGESNHSPFFMESACDDGKPLTSVPFSQ